MMRTTWINTALAAGGIAVLAGSIALTSSPSLAGGDLGKGEEVFVSGKCGMCHDVSSAGITATTKSDKIKGPDLAGVTSRQERDWIAKFIRKQTEKDGSSHKKEFKGSDEELAALLDWLETQQSE